MEAHHFADIHHVAKPTISVKALSVNQPWAWLIVSGPCDVDNRDWITSFRGMFFVHASMRIDEEAIAKLHARGFKLPRTFQTSGIVGSAEVSDCVRGYQSRSLWSDKEGYSLVLRNRRPCKFVPCPGMMKFFPLQREIVHRMVNAGISVRNPGMHASEREAIALEGLR